MALCPEHPKRDQNPKFTPLSETTSIPVCFIWESPPRGLCQSVRWDVHVHDVSTLLGPKRVFRVVLKAWFFWILPGFWEFEPQLIWLKYDNYVDNTINMSNPPRCFKHEWKYPSGFKERIMATSCLLMWLLPWLTDLKSWYSIEVSLLEQSIIMVVSGNLPCIIYLHIRSDKTIFSCKTFHINFFISPFNKLLTFPQRKMRENYFRDLPP